MIAMAGRRPNLMSHMPTVRGQLIADAPLRRLTWFRVGGPAEILFTPADLDDLRHFIAQIPGETPVTLLGLGANVLVRDGGIPGIVIRLGRPFSTIRISDHEVDAGAMALDYNIAKACQRAGLAGFEFMAGIPGTLGGGLAMNAGAYGAEFADVVTRVDAVDPDGHLHHLSPQEWGPHYRGCSVPPDWIFVGATLKGTPGDKVKIAAAMNKVQADRDATQPIRTRTGGSTFKNPPGEKAWELVDRAGCRGFSVGKAMVSEKHCNFLINNGGARAADIEALGEEVRRRVKAATGITLEWEIERLGAPDTRSQP